LATLAVVDHHLPLTRHLHHRFTGPHVDYAGVGLAAAASWIGVTGIGEAALIAAGIAAARGRVDIASIILTAWFGAMVGGVAGWLVGLRWGRTLMTREGPLFRARQRWLRNGELVYRKRGLMAVYFAPSWMAGISGMRAARFVPANGVAAAIWALLVGLGAYFVGPSIAEVVADIGVVGIVALVLVAALTIGARRWRRTRRRS
jgi:membrane protein DedA with SNARE-associated domain